MRSQGSLGQCSAAKTVVENGGTDAAVITVAADADHFWVVDRIDYSYDGAPTGGGLTVVIGGVTVLDIDIVASGPGFVDFSDAPLHANNFPKNEALVVTLKDGGTTTQKLNLRYR